MIEEKGQVQVSINRLKKEIFGLKNEDNLAGRSLVADRGIIEKELKEHENSSSSYCKVPMLVLDLKKKGLLGTQESGTSDL